MTGQESVWEEATSSVVPTNMISIRVRNDDELHILGTPPNASDSGQIHILGRRREAGVDQDELPPRQEIQRHGFGANREVESMDSRCNFHGPAFHHLLLISCHPLSRRPRGNVVCDHTRSTSPCVSRS